MPIYLRKYYKKKIHQQLNEERPKKPEDAYLEELRNKDVKNTKQEVQ
jgi:hypothetical protein